MLSDNPPPPGIAQHRRFRRTVIAFDNPLAAEIWTSKYRFSPDDGTGDQTVEQSWSRVAAAVAEAETPKLRGP